MWHEQEPASLKESLGHGRSPCDEFRRANESITKSPENGGGVRYKTVVEIVEAEKLLQQRWLRMVNNGLDMRGEGHEDRGHAIVAEKVNRGVSKGAFLRINKNTNH